MLASPNSTADEAKFVPASASHMVTAGSAFDSESAVGTKLHVFPFCPSSVLLVADFLARLVGMSHSNAFEAKFSFALVANQFALLRIRPDHKVSAVHSRTPPRIRVFVYDIVMSEDLVLLE